jgi:hypothetical protein
MKIGNGQVVTVREKVEEVISVLVKCRYEYTPYPKIGIADKDFEPITAIGDIPAINADIHICDYKEVEVLSGQVVLFEEWNIIVPMETSLIREVQYVAVRHGGYKMEKVFFLIPQNHSMISKNCSIVEQSIANATKLYGSSYEHTLEFPDGRIIVLRGGNRTTGTNRHYRRIEKKL